MRSIQRSTRKAAILVLSLAIGSIALADGDKEVKVSIPVLAPVTNPLPINSVGTAAYNAQEGAHNTQSGITGVNISHYYVNVSLNGQTVPIDPFTVNR